MIMARILKLDKFSNNSKSMYGLEGDGACFIVKKPFYVEVLSFYNREAEGDIIKLTPSWTRIKLQNGDLISVTKEECYVELKDFEGFIPCRPENPASEETPSFSKFEIENLDRIGKNVMKSKPMPFDERKNVTVVRV